MGALLLCPGFFPLIGAVQLPLCVGQGTKGSGPWLDLLLIVVVVVAVVAETADPGMIISGTCCCSRSFLHLFFSRIRSSRFLLLNLCLYLLGSTSSPN